MGHKHLGLAREGIMFTYSSTHEMPAVCTACAWCQVPSGLWHISWEPLPSCLAPGQQASWWVELAVPWLVLVEYMAWETLSFGLSTPWLFQNTDPILPFSTLMQGK